MQRYMAGDLPKGGPQPDDGERPPLPEAVRLGHFIRQERGREGAVAFVAAVSPLLPEHMGAQLAAQLGVPVPGKGAAGSSAAGGAAPDARIGQAGSGAAPRQEQPPKAKPPDMEAILKLMQMMKGGGGKDLSALMQLLKQ